MDDWGGTPILGNLRMVLHWTWCLADFQADPCRNVFVVGQQFLLLLLNIGLTTQEPPLTMHSSGQVCVCVLILQGSCYQNGRCSQVGSPKMAGTQFPGSGCYSRIFPLGIAAAGPAIASTTTFTYMGGPTTGGTPKWMIYFIRENSI